MLPALVMQPRRTPAPLKCSEGTRSKGRDRPSTGGVSKAREVAHLPDHGDRREQSNAAHGPQVRHGRRHRPTRDQPLDLSGQTCHMGLSVHYGVYMVLAHRLLSRVVETHCRQPALVDLGPALAFQERRGRAAGECLAGADRPSQAPAPLSPESGIGCASPLELRQVLTRPSGHRHGELSEHHGTAPLRLHAVARPNRDQRRNHDQALMPRRGELTVKAIAVLGKPLSQLYGHLGPVRYRAERADLAAACSFIDCHRNCRLMHIQTHKRAEFVGSAPPALRFCAGPPGRILDREIP